MTALTPDDQFAIDIGEAVFALPESAVSLAAIATRTLPGITLSVHERDYLDKVLAQRGDASPSTAQALLTAVIRDPDPQSGAWKSLQAMGRKADALAAMRFRAVVADASVRRWQRHAEALTGA
jgi:hypothetical protein